jgi:hypothetical protein
MEQRKTELIQGPVQQWEPCEEDKELVEHLLASEDELDNAYGEAYQNRCFVREFAPGLTGVGELDKLMEIELRLGIELGVEDLTLGDCVELAYPGSGETRAERVRDGLRQVLEARAESA